VVARGPATPQSPLAGRAGEDLVLLDLILPTARAGVLRTPPGPATLPPDRPRPTAKDGRSGSTVTGWTRGPTTTDQAVRVEELMARIARCCGRPGGAVRLRPAACARPEAAVGPGSDGGGVANTPRVGPAGAVRPQNQTRCCRGRDRGSVCRTSRSRSAYVVDVYVRLLRRKVQWPEAAVSRDGARRRLTVRILRVLRFSLRLGSTCYGARSRWSCC